MLTSVEIRIYQITTRQCVKRIPVDGSQFSHMILSSTSKVWLFNLGGEGCVVDLEEEDAEVTKLSLDIPIIDIIDIINDTTFIVLSSTDRVNGTEPTTSRRYLLKHSLLEGKTYTTDETATDSKELESPENKWNTSVISYVDNFKNFAISSNEKYFVFTASSSSSDLVIAGELDTDYNLVHQMPPVKRKHRSLALAISDSGVAAVGSLGGAIDLYYNIADKNRPSSLFPRTLKWHIDPAKALTFSLDGNYLLSGGNERVLVFWQLDTGRSQFLPRLNGDISGIVVDNSSELYAIQMGDNEVVVFSSLDLLSRLQIAGIKAQLPTSSQQQKDQVGAPKHSAPIVSCPFYINPRTKHSYLSLPYASLIQAYDTQRDEQVGVVTVSPAIQAGKVKIETSIKDAEVTQVCFTHDGKWMATVDEYTPPTIDRLLSRNDTEINLKFWRFVEGNWTLATRVAAPHGDNVKVRVIPAGAKFNNGNAFLTTGSNGGLRLWMPQLADSENETDKSKVNGSNEKSIIKVGKEYLDVKYSWAVRRDVPGLLHRPSSVAAGWSSDGSVVVLALGSLMYIIDGETFEIKGTIPNFIDSSIVTIEVVGSRLVILSQTRLVVYDLINCTQVWSLGVSFGDGEARNMMAVDTTANVIALAVNSHVVKSKTSRVYIFSLDSPLPLDVKQYKTYVSCIRHIPGSTLAFQILTSELRFVNLTLATTSTEIITEITEDALTVDSFESSLSSLYSSAQPVHSTRRLYVPDFDNASEAISIASFDKVFEDASAGVNSMTELFDRVMNVISHRN